MFMYVQGKAVGSITESDGNFSSFYAERCCTFRTNFVRTNHNVNVNMKNESVNYESDSVSLFLQDVTLHGELYNNNINNTLVV